MAKKIKLIRKRKEIDGKNTNFARYIWQQYFGEIPEGLFVHHLDGDKSNDSIDNLALMTVTAHNRLHRHPSWNKGMTVKDNPAWNKAHRKSVKVRYKNYLKLCKETFALQTKGMKLREIALKQGISCRQVSERIKTYKEYLKEERVSNDKV